MNVAFTIVAKNYFSFAITLADSIKKEQPELPFYILLVDAKEGLDEKYFAQYNIVTSTEIGIADFLPMSFKYNVTEFSTAVKPFFIDYLFNRKKFDKVIYFDPDIYLYQSPATIFNELDNHSVIITNKKSLHFHGKILYFITCMQPHKGLYFIELFISNSFLSKKYNWQKNHYA